MNTLRFGSTKEANKMGVLKERLRKRNEDIAKGRWPELTLLKSDPLKWELLYYQLLGMVQEGREIARLISASPTVREFGECVFALFTPEGESIAFSRGILLHMASMGSSIKWMLDNDYEELVGIHDGDIFYNNDPDIGGAHAADQAVLIPVFHEGKLVAWVGGLTHVVEVGGTEPGGMSPSALTRYDDGQIVPCMKVGVNDQFNHDFHVMASRNTRDGSWWILDDKAKLAGCLKMKQGLLKSIETVGIDYFAQATTEMVESGRQFAVNKIKASLFPGRYRQVACYDVANATQPLRIARDYLTVMPLEATITAAGTINFDWEGCSPAGFHSNNSSLCSTIGNHIYTMLQDCLSDGFFNQGMQYSFDVHVPKGAVLNPDIGKACSAWLTIVAAVAGGITPVLARAFYSKGFREEGFASKPGNGGLFAGGLDKNGQIFTSYNFETNCSGAGAQSCYDGLNAATSCWNPEVNMSDAETYEHTWPLMWLGRGVLKDGGGYGRRRGGAPVESLYVIENEPQYIEAGASGSCDNVFVSTGLFGGYPAPSRYRYSYKNTNYKELVEKMQPLPHREGDDPSHPDFTRLVKGELVRGNAQDAAQRMAPYDLIMQSSGGGGGWGDPLERKTAEIAADLKAQLVSPLTVEKVYKVVFVPGTDTIDEEKTAAARDAERKARLARAIPVSDFMEAQRKKILSQELSAIAKTTYNEIFKISPKFLAEFKEFWSLPEDYKGF
jgi:acetone carboxylase, alpha subunit